MRPKTLLKELLLLPFHKSDMVDKIPVTLQTVLMVPMVPMVQMAPMESTVEMEQMAQEMLETDLMAMDLMVMDLMVEMEVLLLTHKITLD